MKNVSTEQDFVQFGSRVSKNILPFSAYVAFSLLFYSLLGILPHTWSLQWTKWARVGGGTSRPIRDTHTRVYRLHTLNAMFPVCPGDISALCMRACLSLSVCVCMEVINARGRNGKDLSFIDNKMDKSTLLPFPISLFLFIPICVFLVTLDFSLFLVVPVYACFLINGERGPFSNSTQLV